MLEKIGLPAKPSRRGNNWVLDASNCQGCSSQFTFINRKHHCRRCGGLFCNICTLQRMFLRGQGDSPVRICDPCKKLEEAARFELRHGHKAKAGRGGVRLKSNTEDEEVDDVIQRATIGSSMSSAQVSNVQDVERGLSRSHSVDVLDHLRSEMTSAGPEELRQQALDEKKQYKILKDKGKTADALQAFKRAKELERNADALEINLRRNRKKSVVYDKMAETTERDLLKESSRKHKTGLEVGKEKHDLTAELRELGWSDMDLHEEDKKSTTITLEGELLSLVKGVSQKTNKDKSVPVIEDAQVVAHKRKALTLKREGKLAEAKEELKKAKILEKQVEEQALLAEAEDSDEEFSELIRSMDDDKEEEFSILSKKDPGFDFNHLLRVGEDLLVESNFEVTEEDMEDPEIAGALESFGWTDDREPSLSEKIATRPMHGDRESLTSEIYSLKKEALNYKRSGNIAEAMEQLKKAKLLERDLERLDSQADNANPPKLGAGSVKPVQEIDTKLSSRSRLSIQRELLDLKKKVLTLKREGKLDEADELLKESKVLEYQLEQVNNTPEKTAPVSVSAASKNLLMHKQHTAYKNDVDDEVSEDVTDQDMHDPTYLSLLKNLGWNNEDDELTNPPSTSSEQNDVPSIGMSESLVASTTTTKLLDHPSKRSKAEVQRELLSLKRKALALRRQGQNDEADEVLGKAKELEKEIVEIESRSREVGDEFKRHQGRTPKLPHETVDEEGAVDVTDKDMHDPALLSVLKNLGWNDDEVEPEQDQGKSNEQTLYNKGQSPFTLPTTSSMNPAPRSKGEVQKELLNLKRKALALRRKGETNEADEVLKSAKVLEMQMEELEAPKLAVSLNTVENNESVTYGYARKNKNQEPMVETPESTMVALESNDKADSSSSTRNIESGSIPDISTGMTSKLIEESHPLFTKIESSLPDFPDFPGNAGMLEDTQFIPTAAKSVNTVDLLTGDNWGSSQVVIETHNDVFNSNKNALADSTQSGSSKKSDNVASKAAITINKEVIVQRNPEQEQGILQESTQELYSQTSKVSLQQEILVHKRLAVTLKREGRVAEALEELRKAKLMEKSLEENTSQAQVFSSDLSISAPTIPSPVQKEHDSTKPAPKILSSRDRFKLQQESLGHKRNALKLRREGRIQEAESEFELAKQIETQLDSAAHDSANGVEPVDDTSVEDFLDPQLLSALRAIGIEGPKVEARGQSIPEPVKTNVAKGETSDVGRAQLEEQIKTEKIKAVNLKRAGKPSEALDALRRAKLLEKKLNSL